MTEDREPSAESFEPRPGWWMQVVRVRLRFVLIVVVVGVTVSQWTLMRSVWDRWIERARLAVIGWFEKRRNAGRVAFASDPA